MFSKRKIVPREKVEKMLVRAQRKKAYTNPNKWGENTGRSLYNFRRIHYLLVNNFTIKQLGKMCVTHLGAGNGIYMDFLAKKFGTQVTSIEPNQKYISKFSKKIKKQILLELLLKKQLLNQGHKTSCFQTTSSIQDIYLYMMQSQ